MNATVSTQSLQEDLEILIACKPILEADFVNAQTHEEKYNAVQALMKHNYEITCVRDKISQIEKQELRKIPFWKLLFQK